PSPVKLRVICGGASQLTTNRGAGKQTGPAQYCRARSCRASARVAAYQARIEPETDWQKPASSRWAGRPCDHRKDAAKGIYSNAGTHDQSFSDHIQHSWEVTLPRQWELLLVV